MHTLFTCLLFSLSSCCLPREPAALARGTCQACVYRTRSRYPGTCQLPPPLELTVECAERRFTLLCSGPGTAVPLCVACKGSEEEEEEEEQDFFRAGGENRLVPCMDSHWWKRRACSARAFAEDPPHFDTTLSGAF